MYRILAWILILHTLHVPVFVPDTDGECRGTPIESLIESHAWHPVLLGVRPNDDVDRGPFRADNEQDSTFDGAQFGDLAILKMASVSSFDIALAIPVNCLLVTCDLVPHQADFPATGLLSRLAGRSVCVCYCIWRI